MPLLWFTAVRTSFLASKLAPLKSMLERKPMRLPVSTATFRSLRIHSPEIATLLTATGLVAILASSSAKGADLLAPGSYDPHATGRVSSADTAPRGAYFGGLSLQTAEGAAPHGLMSKEDPNAPLLRDAHRGSLFFGYSLSDAIELNLGLHGTYEHVKSEDRARLSSAAAIKGEKSDQRPKQSGFSGASLMLKMQVAELSGLRLGLAPFVETGAGEGATYSLTRSVGPKAGFMALATYGSRGVATVDVNAGYRYRDAEEITSEADQTTIKLRNEGFYGASVQGYFSRDFSVFAAGQGRSIKVAQGDNLKKYESKSAGEATVGLKAYLEGAEIAAFAGKSLGGGESFGYGNKTAGLSVAVELGNFRGRAPRSSYASEIEANERAKKAAGRKKGAKKAADAAATYADYPEMSGDVDHLQIVGTTTGGDDFTRAEESKKRQQTDKNLPDDEKVERELKELREAEAKAEAERAAEERARAAEARKVARKRAAEDEKIMKEYMDEAKQAADSLPGITDEEATWNGLND